MKPGLRILVGLGATGILAANATASPATRLLISNDPCLIFVCPAVHPPVPQVTRAGESFGLYVIALDASGVPDFDYTGTITFESSDPEARLPPSYTFVHADEARRAFEATLRTAGTQTITVHDSGNGPAPSTLTMQVTDLPGSGIPTLDPLTKAGFAMLLATTAMSILRRQG